MLTLSTTSFSGFVRLEHRIDAGNVSVNVQIDAIPHMTGYSTLDAE